jgi:very-short-patch-repair endonuclease
MKYILKSNKRGDGHQLGEIVCPRCNSVVIKRLTMINYKKAHNLKHYCSRKCFNLDTTTIPIQYCIICKKEITKHKGHIRKFCSRVCYDIWQKDSDIRLCMWCKSSFIIHKNSKRKYCSKHCALARTGETTIETLMRKELEVRNILFEQYKKIGNFYIDFYLPQTNTIIECDGLYWHTKPEVIERDIRKNEYLTKLGYNVIRFTDKEILSDVSKCVNSI